MLATLCKNLFWIGEEFKLKKVLVTGGAGMVGRHVKDQCKALGWEVFSPQSDELDLRNANATLDYIESVSPELIFHCAAYVGGIAINIAHPADFIMENILIDSSLLSASRKLRVSNLIYIASSCMYPANFRQPLKESDLLCGPLEKTNEGFALAKIAGLTTVSSVATQDNLNWKTVIPSNLYGPSDKFDLDRGHLIAAVITKTYRAILNGESTIEIWGTGNARREFTYVNDFANFIVTKSDESTLWPSYMNIGVGVDFTVFEYYTMIAEIMGYKGRFIFKQSAPEGMVQKLMDSSTARRFGWKPQTNIYQGLEKSIEWYNSIVS